MEGRKYGLHLVAITQSPKALNENAVKNSFIKIIHMLREVDDAKYMADSIGDPALWKEFIELDVGEAIISQKRAVRVVIDST
jgi:DNA helicase HerA-like ATPase